MDSNADFPDLLWPCAKTRRSGDYWSSKYWQLQMPFFRRNSFFSFRGICFFPVSIFHLLFSFWSSGHSSLSSGNLFSKFKGLNVLKRLPTCYRNDFPDMDVTTASAEINDRKTHNKCEELAFIKVQVQSFDDFRFWRPLPLGSLSPAASYIPELPPLLLLVIRLPQVSANYGNFAGDCWIHSLNVRVILSRCCLINWGHTIEKTNCNQVTPSRHSAMNRRQ